MTPEQLNELERLANAATPGPWTYDDGVDVQCDFPSTVPYQEKNREAAVIGPWAEGDPFGPTVFTDDDVKDADAAFIAAARTAVPDLIAEVRRLTEEWALSAQTGLAEIEALRAENAALQAVLRTQQP